MPRGIDSKGVIDQLISLGDRCRLVPILGNHEEMMLGAREGWSDLRFWIDCAGLACLDSYGSTGRIDLIPRSHFTFLESCRTYFETERHFFVHANYKPGVPLDRLDVHTLRWLSLRDYVPPTQHCSGSILGTTTGEASASRGRIRGEIRDAMAAVPVSQRHPGLTVVPIWAYYQ